MRTKILVSARITHSLFPLEEILQQAIKNAKPQRPRLKRKHRFLSDVKKEEGQNSKKREKEQHTEVIDLKRKREKEQQETLNAASYKKKHKGSSCATKEDGQEKPRVQSDTQQSPKRKRPHTPPPAENPNKNNEETDKKTETTDKRRKVT